MFLGKNIALAHNLYFFKFLKKNLNFFFETIENPADAHLLLSERWLEKEKKSFFWRNSARPHFASGRPNG
jgi:hypothetical protein